MAAPDLERLPVTTATRCWFVIRRTKLRVNAMVGAAHAARMARNEHTGRHEPWRAGALPDALGVWRCGGAFPRL